MAHLDAEVLAEFRAGLITGRRGASITAHLASCERCTDLGDQLAGVSALLASVPVPAMPDLVAQRLDTVLAAEAASPDHAERARADRLAHPATDHGRTPRRPASRRLSFRLLSARVLAPVAVILLAAGGYGLSRAIGPGGQAASSSAAAGSAASPEKAAPSNASSAQSRVNAPASAPARGAQGTVPRPYRITAANFTLVASSTDFSAASLKRQVETELSRAAPAGGSGAAQPVPPQLRACVQNLTHGATLVRVESARFAGQPATLVVARAGSADMAWIAGPDCSATSRDVLATTSVP